MEKEFEELDEMNYRFEKLVCCANCVYRYGDKYDLHHCGLTKYGEVVNPNAVCDYYE